MAVSSFCGTYSLVAQSLVVADWQQLSGFEWVKPFEEQERFAHDVGETRKRAGTLTELFEQNFPSQKSKLVLRTFLNRILQLFDFEKDSKLVERSFLLISKRSCITGLALGTFGALLTQHPLPLFLGLSQCSPSAQAQQKIGTEFQINNYTANDQAFPGVASFSNGNFVVTWHSNGQDGSSHGVYGQLFDENGNKIGGEFRVNSYTTNGQFKPSVASFSNGNFVMTWTSSAQDGSSHGVYGQLFNGNATKIGSEFRANSYTTNDQRDTSVASLANGHFVGTWESDGQDGSSWGVYGQLFNGNSTKLGSEFLANAYTNSHQFASSVASFSNGNFVVTWSSDVQDGSLHGVYGQLFDGNGTKIGSEFQANSYVTSYQDYPSVASFSNGNFVVIWASYGQDDSLHGVYGQLFDGNGTKIGSEFRANTYSADDQWFSSVASFSNGNFVVTWHSNGQDGSLYGVYGQLFDENGNKIGGEFRVNSYTTSHQRSPSVASFSNGNFIVTWQSENQDGSGYGVYGQIFSDNITYPPTSSTTISSITSTTSSTTTSTTRSKSSSTTTSSTISTSSPSAKSSKSSSTVRTSKSSIFRSSSRISHEISSSSSPSNKRFLWLWLLLGIGSGTTCLGFTVIFFLKSRNKKVDGDVLTSELGEIEQVNGSTGEGDYQYTPDIVKPEDRRQYGRLSHDSTTEGDYQYTPDHVTQEEHYQRTPDHVHPL